jgi:hypothetical protein
LGAWGREKYCPLGCLALQAGIQPWNANAHWTNMEYLAGLVAAFLFWRVVAAVVASVAVGALISLFIPEYGPASIAVCSLLGVATGLIWQSQADHPGVVTPEVEAPMSKPVAFLGLAFVGGIWGGLGEVFFHSALIPASALVLAPFVVGPVIGALVKRNYAFGQLAFAACALVSGVAVPYAIQMAFAN